MSIGSVSSGGSSSKDNALPVLKPIDEKVKKITTITFKEIGQAIYNSPTVRSLAAAGIVIGGGLIALALIGGLATPPGWVIAAAAVTIFAISMVLQKDKVLLDFGSTTRLIWRKQFNEIPLKPGENAIVKGKIWLGASPNKLSQDVRRLFEKTGKGGVHALLEVNDAWELQARGPSIPISKDNIEENENQVKWIEQKDHTLLDNQQMGEAADFIHERVSQGQNIYVHCLGGKGRSAMAVAAYLIKYEKMPVEGAIKAILDVRDFSTIQNKREGLEKFQNSLKRDQVVL